ncbi:MAG: 2,3,4,5-tetrahydropyridine-2,6-dicarboxylate N-succinyltransferase [Pseudomonadota bacterium]
MSENLKRLIEKATQSPELIKQAPYRESVFETVAELDNGTLRVAEKTDGQWGVNVWVKQAILFYFQLADMQVMEAGPFEYYDKIPLKKGLKALGIRVVPPATLRYGCFVEKGAVIMPSYINIGARVGSGTMVDTWATVGSCAQIGNNVHLSGGVGIGGVLEPPAAKPVIIEDGVFLGSRSIVVEGVCVEQEAVLAANVTLTSSTPIIDVTGEKEVIHKGRVPACSVVVPGVREKKFKAGTYQVSCALIIGQRKATTDQKTSLNEVLRDFAISV